MTDLKHPHRRQNILTGEWVLVSPQRIKRPWQGNHHPPKNDKHSSYDPHCYLCPGNSRADGKRNPDYTGSYLFSNDFPALLPEAELTESESPLFQVQSVSGTCRVLCFSERHDLTLPELELGAVERVVQVWVEQAQELGERYRCVQILYIFIYFYINGSGRCRIDSGGYLDLWRDRGRRARRVHHPSDRQSRPSHRVVAPRAAWRVILPAA